MSGRASPDSSLASRDDFAPRPERLGSKYKRPPQQRVSRPAVQRQPPVYQSTRSGAVRDTAYSARPPVRWDWSYPFDEGEYDRRNKGKEVVPYGPPTATNPFSPWPNYSGDYASGAYGPSQPYQPPLTEDNRLKLPGTYGNPYNQQTGTERRGDTRNLLLETGIHRDIHGVLTPESGDLTVHLTMDLVEDLEYQLEEINRFSRLGHFSSAKAFFDEHLQHHLDNPYVLVQYADLLLRQGDFKAVTLLENDVIYKHEGDKSDSQELKMLRVNWALLRTLAKSRTLDDWTRLDVIFQGPVDIFNQITNKAPPDRVIDSTEIEILALALRLTGDPVHHDEGLTYGHKVLNAFSVTLVRLYQTLLHQGRIWDLHDFMVLLPCVEDTREFCLEVFKKDLVPGLEALISDWSESINGYNASTTLALLSILTHILLEPVQASEKDCVEIFNLCLPLAQSMLKNDPATLKSRPYLRLLLAKSRFAETASRQAIHSLKSHIQYQPGVFYQPDPALLPVYLPYDDETPKWTPMEQPSELRDPVKLVLRSAIDLGDLETEAIARRELIRLSDDPREEFDMLCTLQLSRQGDLNGYSWSLASKYLISNTEVARMELKNAISRFMSMKPVTAYCGPTNTWVLNMLLFKGERKSPAAIQHILQRASTTDYSYIDESLLRELSKKMPEWADWVEQQFTRNSTWNTPKVSILRVESGPRRGHQHAAIPKSPQIRHVKEQQSTQVDHNIVKEPENNQQNHQLQPESRLPPKPTEKSREKETVKDPGSGQGNPISRHASFRDVGDNDDEDDLYPHVLSFENVKENDLAHTRRSRNDRELMAEIRAKLEVEFDERIKAEEERGRRQENEKVAQLEALQKELEAFRQMAVEERIEKMRIEADERIEKLRWEKSMAESKLEKAAAEMAHLKAAEAEFHAKLEAKRKEREEEEIRMKYEEQYKAEDDMIRRIEAEKKFRDEAETAVKEQLQQEAEAETSKTLETQSEANEEAHGEKIRQWATEKAEMDLESESDLQIHFTNAIGRKFTFPFSRARTWEGMRELVEAVCLPVAEIETGVRGGHYDLIGPDDIIVLPSIWNDIVQPGWEIKMQMWPMVSTSPSNIPPSNPVHGDMSSGLIPDQSANIGVSTKLPPTSVRPSLEQPSTAGLSFGEPGSGSVRPSRIRGHIRGASNAFSSLKAKILHRPRRGYPAATPDSEPHLSSARRSHEVAGVES